MGEGWANQEKYHCKCYVCAYLSRTCYLRITTVCVQVINKPCAREIGYMRLISWIRHRGNEHLLQVAKKLEMACPPLLLRQNRSEALEKKFFLMTIYIYNILTFSLGKQNLIAVMDTLQNSVYVSALFCILMDCPHVCQQSKNKRTMYISCLFYF